MLEYIIVFVIVIFAFWGVILYFVKNSKKSKCSGCVGCSLDNIEKKENIEKSYIKGE